MRASIPDMTEFFDWMDRSGHRYVVLRSFLDLDQGYPEKGGKRDIDMLVDDEALPLIRARYHGVSKRDGVKCDFYSVSGKDHGGYLGYPYMPSDLAQQTLDRRRKWKNLFYVPAAREHLLSLLYHIAYQKAELSKLEIDAPSESKYKPELDMLMTELGISLPHSLSAFDAYLKKENIPIADDILAAYIQNDYARHHVGVSPFYCRLCAARKGEMNMFVIRDIAVKTGRHEKFIELLRDVYEVLLVKDIPWWTKMTQSKKMRGGKWSRGGRPAILVLVYDPQPIPTTPEDRLVHKHVFNARQFVKREWREWFTRETGSKPSANPIHSTDNEAEAIGHMPLFLSRHEQEDVFRRLAARRSAACAG